MAWEDLSPPLPSACRKRPDRTVYAQMHNTKEQEMTSPLGHSQGVPGAVQREDFIDGDLHSQTLGNTSRSPPHPPIGPHALPGAHPTLP